MESAVELFHGPSARLSGLPQETLGSIGNLDQEFCAASVPLPACCDCLQTQP
jgi:hypothetical protein